MGGDWGVKFEVNGWMLRGVAWGKGVEVEGVLFEVRGGGWGVKFEVKGWRLRDVVWGKWVEVEGAEVEVEGF